MGIKSFQGARQEIKREYLRPIAVADYMTRKLITFTPEQCLLEVMETFMKHKITGAPVIDENGKLIGIISDSDCMKQISEGRYFNMPIGDMVVRKYMSSDVMTINGDASIFDAATQFHKTRHRRFPVVENGFLIGQISRKDVMLAALKLSGHHWR
ncbi:CBS domain-containing protein [Sinomicrobium pectinilyticum]|uniref:CBS domain-containing protein n=1 Tax=Sinomicrobium pectinilyticum TaxID=1084421 RepID=A0A3N0D1V2_SINP1|nr:CBS domain-containing protein [Sinomicrobium pectinilyticum]RNL69233.1 CBS domain-containing protein [Sinomicrobium pectinilyticum]